MGASEVLQAIARAYLQRERDRVGITARDMEAQKVAAATQSAGTEDLVRQAQIAKTLQDMGFAPDEHAAHLGLIKAQTEAANSLAGQRNTPKPQPQGTLNPIQNDAGEVVGYYSNKPSADGTVQFYDHRGNPVGAAKAGAAAPAGAPAGDTGVTPPPATVPDRYRTKAAPQPKTPPTVLVKTVDEKGNPVTKVVPKTAGAEFPSAPTAQQQQTAGMAATVKDNVAKMEALANHVTAGPIAGRLSRASQSIFGPHGPEGDFDFLGNAVVDIVYIKSGKQINETELRNLSNMIPNRSRGNLPQQVKLFGDYANSLLQKYGGSDTGAEPAAPAAPAAAPSGFRIVGVRDH